jgi:hypothetical protein
MIGLWADLLEVMSAVLYTNEQSTPHWSFSLDLPFIHSKAFTMFSIVVVSQKKFPLKCGRLPWLIKYVYVWLLFPNKLLTRDNLDIVKLLVIK